MARWAISFAEALPDVARAFTTGGGVPWERFGDHGRQAQSDINRPLFLNLLGREWIPAIPDVHERLQGEPPARVADVACGAGWSSIALAQAYPRIHVDGFEVDEISVELARSNVEEAGLTGRVHMHLRDAGDPELTGAYDIATVFEAVHDMPRPVEVLGAMRRLTAPGGTVIVMDERVSDRFTAPGDEVERVMYTYSVLSCLPVGMSEQPSAATGTVMRADTLRRYAEKAGFGEVEVLPVEHDFFRLYRLHP